MSEINSQLVEQSNTMEESDKLPLKRVELSLSKFNEVAFPHHLDLLRQHKVNIVKHEARGELTRVRGEQAHARRVAQQLRALLAELEALRGRVRAADLPRFDALTQRSRDNTLKAIVEYLELSPAAESAPRGSLTSMESVGAEPAPPHGSVTSTESVGVLPAALHLGDALQLHADDQEAALREREAALRGWVALQDEVRALHEAWQHVQAAALHQRADVAASAAAVDVAADNAEGARRHLSAAERLRASAWVCGGAVCGALAGGPVGLAVGLKAGAAAALAGSLLGALGLRALSARALAPAPAPAPDKHKGD